MRVKLTIIAKDVDDIATLFENDTEQELQINTVSGASQLNFKFANLVIHANKAADGNKVAWSIEANEADILQKGGKRYRCPAGEGA